MSAPFDEFEVRRYPEGTRTAADAAAAIGCDVAAATGHPIGGTPPFGHPAPVPTLCDPSLLELDELWAAAGTPDTVFAITPARLVELTGAAVVDVTVPV